MDRREFLGLVGVGGVVSCLPATLAACTPQTQSTSAVRSDGFLAVGTVTELDQKGLISAKDAAGSPVLVVRNPANSEAIVAVNATCTHAGCAVNWTQDQQSFVCPCHDSKFAADGKVLQGPATTPLPAYTAKIEGDTVLVKQA